MSIVAGFLLFLWRAYRAFTSKRTNFHGYSASSHANLLGNVHALYPGISILACCILIGKMRVFCSSLETPFLDLQHFRQKFAINFLVLTRGRKKITLKYLVVLSLKGNKAKGHLTTK